MPKSKQIKFAYRPIEKLKPYERNPRKHPQSQIKELEASIKKFGFCVPILIDSKNRMITGHGRVIAAKNLGHVEVPCVIATHLSENERDMFVIADNQLTMSSTWDNKLMTYEINRFNDLGMDLKLLGMSEEKLHSYLVSTKETKNKVGDIEFSSELGEAQNYIVLTFDTDVDFLAAKTHFGLKPKYSKRQNGKPWSKGIGRVVDGAAYLERIKNNGKA